jgi:CBS domain-containing protein
MLVGEICNREVVIASADESVMQAARLMRENHVGDVVVVEEQEGVRVPKGILTDRDIVIELIAQAVDLDTVNIGDVMSYELLIALESEDVLDILKRMRAKGVRRVPVVNQEGGLEGILTADDVIDLVAEQLKDLTGLTKRQLNEERELIL